MELRNVKTFIKIAEIGNFSKAATELGYAQSTVTMQIQTLERELGVSLFERNGKSAVLSAAGKEFLDYAYNLQRCEAMALEHFAEGADPGGEVSVGIMETLCASRYGIIFREFKKRYPRANIKVVVATTLECMGLLGKGKLDLILTVDKKINRINWVTAHEVPTEIRFLSGGSPVCRKKGHSAGYGSGRKFYYDRKRAAITVRHLNSMWWRNGDADHRLQRSGTPG